MAKNYTIAEAVKVIAKGTNGEELVDIGRRFPLMSQKAAKIAAKAGDDFVEFMECMPDYLTATKVNNGLKAKMLGGSDEETEETEDETPEEVEEKKEKKPVKKTKKAKKEEPEDDEDDDEETEPEPETEDDDEDEESGKYDGMKAPELFKECKKRKIKAEPKKSAKVYIALLEKDDAKAAKKENKKVVEEDEEDDDWDI